jgi:hypothetical protein
MLPTDWRVSARPSRLHTRFDVENLALLVLAPVQGLVVDEVLERAQVLQ